MIELSASNPEPDFEDVVNQYERELYRLILVQVEDPQIAEDLTQEAFLNAYRSFSSRNVDDDLHLWLCRFALEQCKSYWRSKWREEEEGASE